MEIDQCTSVRDGEASRGIDVRRQHDVNLQNTRPHSRCGETACLSISKIIPYTHAWEIRDVNNRGCREWAKFVATNTKKAFFWLTRCAAYKQRKGRDKSLLWCHTRMLFVLRGWQCIGCCEDGNALDVVSITDIVTQQASVVGLHACAPSCLPRQCSCFK